MKTATLILSLFMFFKPVLPVVEYVVLYDYIKNELCVNKDKPELECNGKCHLKKELAKAYDSENSKEKPRFFSVENHIVFYQEITSDTLFSFSMQYVQKTLFSSDIIYRFSFSGFIFRPPISM